MAYDSHKNFAYSLIAVAPSPSASGTSITVTAGQGALFPTPPFNATVWPAASIPITTNSEIVRVTNIVGDVLTITRAQESTTARAIITGDQIANTITAKILTDVENASYPPLPHDMITSHTYTGGAALDVFGLSGANTIAKLTPSSDVSGGASALLASNAGALTLKALTVSNASIGIGGFALTIPATGTAALLATANVFTANQAIYKSAVNGYSEFEAINNGNTLDYRCAVGIGGTATGDRYQNRGYLLTGQNVDGLILEAYKAGSYISFFFLGTEKIRAESTDIAMYGVSSIDYPEFRAQNNGGTADYRAAFGVGGTATGDIYQNCAYFISGSSLNALLLQVAKVTGYIAYSVGLSTEVARINSTGFGFGTTAPATALHGKLTNASTNVIDNIGTLEHASSGTPAAGFGSGLRFGLASSTTANQDAARLTVSWVVATHASRTARLALLASDSAGEREGMRVEGSGTAPLVGFYGATAVARATTGGTAATFVANTSGIANDTATWGGYTVGQVVKALQNIGILT